MSVSDLLDLVKENLDLPSDYALQQPLDAEKQEISRWRTGKGFPGPYHAAKIAEALGWPLERVMGHLYAEKEKSPERRAYWANLAKVAGWSILILGLFSNPNPAFATSSR